MAGLHRFVGSMVAGVPIFSIDIGGSKVKAVIIGADGELQGEPQRRPTPDTPVPEVVVKEIELLAKDMSQFGRIAVGFPGVVKQGVVFTAVNLHADWVGFDLARELEGRLGCPCRVANDADVQGYGAIRGEGVEMVITLGTGFGSSLFVDGMLVPNLEMGHHPLFKKGETYEDLLGKAGQKESGKAKWESRLMKAIEQLENLFNYDRLYIGGGEAKKLQGPIPENVTIVSNLAGLIGGRSLWDPMRHG